MIALDTNLLVYAHRREAREHPAALDLLRRFAESGSPWAIPWPCIYEFFSVVSNVRIWKSAASTPEQAWLQLEAWFAAPGVQLLAETAGFTELLAGFARRARVRGPIVHDARVAAICVAHGVTKLLTRDRDFSLFPELVTEDPLRAR
ncbi:MAG: type II toxin-antitoxin system VapC family toxin [Longimicrobiales bacterium]